jgi:hypothetical protein
MPAEPGRGKDIIPTETAVSSVSRIRHNERMKLTQLVLDELEREAELSRRLTVRSRNASR